MPMSYRSCFWYLQPKFVNTSRVLCMAPFYQFLCYGALEVVVILLLLLLTMVFSTALELELYLL